ncbi:hypothetical protein ABKN59_007161 [Abortiporus biennis]
MHRSCRLLFPLETILLIFSMLQVARAFVQRRDDALPCNGDFAKLNNGGQSPCSLYNQTQLPCNSIGGYSPTTCQCNLVAFNLQSACSSCQSAKPWSWDDWSRKNGCPQNLTMAKDLPFTLGNVPIPSWAHNDLTADGQFDLSAALQRQSWSPLQIALPIVLPVVISVVAGVAFLWYRHSRKKNTRRRHAWEDAKLHAPRRCFGLLPGRRKVRHKAPDQKWSIDGIPNSDTLPNLSQEQETLYLHPEPTTQGSAHSRSTSAASLLPSNHSSSHTRDNSESNSPFSTLAHKISVFSLSKNYTTGVAKDPSYKRVAVHAQPPNAQFRIDESEANTPRSWRKFSLPKVFRSGSKDSSLPSVIDIRKESSSGLRVEVGAEHTIPLYDEPGPSKPLVPLRLDPNNSTMSDIVTTNPGPRSDYSVTTNDLMTPISTLLRFDRSVGSSDVMTPTTSSLLARIPEFPDPPAPSRPPRPDSVVLPGPNYSSDLDAHRS